MRIPSIKIIAVLLPLGFFFAGCNKSQQDNQATTAPAAANPITIAVIPKGTIHEYWKTVDAGAQQAAKESGAQIIWKGPLKEDDRDAQIAVVDDFVSRGVSGIVLAPLDKSALRIPVESAMRASIPVVIFDSGLDGKAGTDYVSFIATDNFKGGQIAGEYMAKILGDHGSVVVLRYAIGSDSTTQREDGFLDAIAKHPGIKVLSSNQYAGVTTDSAMSAGEDMINRFKKPDGSLAFDGIFCATEPTTFGMLRALDGAGQAGKIKFVGFDSSAKMIEALQAGQLSGFVVQNPYRIGYLAVKTMVAHLKGQPVETRIDTGATLITGENIHRPDIDTLLHPKLND
ncbi:MAG TPA: substrate-binding domain-containing protein [Tepidisphaeraceae bacterium]|jgi:ribose transport system substrate-binding protein